MFAEHTAAHLPVACQLLRPANKQAALDSPLRRLTLACAFADVYSLGVVAFELWHPFATGARLARACPWPSQGLCVRGTKHGRSHAAGMERAALLADLQAAGALPAEWEAAQPQVRPRRPARARHGVRAPALCTDMPPAE